MYRLLRKLLLVAALAVWCAPAFSELRTLYVDGDNIGWKAPVTANEEAFANSKLTETAEGSNIYEGVLTAPASNYWYFRIYTALFESENPDEWSHAYANLVNPVGECERGTDLIVPELGLSGCFSVPVEVKEHVPDQYAKTYKLENTANKNVAMRVDLNSNKFYAWDYDNARVIYFSNQEVPTLETLDQYYKVNDSGANAAVIYVPAGDCKFKFYNVGKKQSLGYSGGDFAIDKINKKTSIRPSSEGDGWFTVNNWKGGVLNVYTASDKYGFVTVMPDVVEGETPVDYTGAMVLRLDDRLFEPWSGASKAVMDQYAAVAFPEADGSYHFNVDMPKGGFRVRFVSGLAAKGENNTLFVPGSDDRELVFNAKGEAYSRAASSTDGDSGYWTYPEWAGGPVEVTVTTGANPSVKFNIGENSRGWYLVGTPNDWESPTAANADFYKDWQLTPCAEGMYGEFEIPAAPQFRFFKELGGWSADCSVGSAQEDFYVKTCELGDKFVDNYVDNGLGNWEFPDWQGGKMYILINTENRTITLSKNPIEYHPAGAEQTGLWFEGINGMEKMEKVADGVYYGLTFSTDNLKIFTRQLPISPDEPEWACSYVLAAPSADYLPVYDRFNVAEVKYAVNEGVSTEAPDPIVLEKGNGGVLLLYRVTVDTNTKTLYLERDCNHNIYLTGSFNGDKLPTIKTRAEFADYYYNSSTRNGLFLNLPAGKNEIAFMLPGLGWTASGMGAIQTADVELVDGFAYYHKYDWNYGFLRTRSVISDWKGGLLFVNSSRFIDFENIEEIRWRNYIPGTGMEYATLTRSDRNGVSFSGKVTLKPGGEYYCEIPNPAYDEANPSPEVPYNKLTIGGDYYETDGIGWSYTPDQNYYFDGNDLSINIGYDHYGCKLPQVTSEREMNVTVDLLANTIKGSVAGEAYKELASISSDNSDLEQALNPSAEADNMQTVVLPGVPAGETGFNILDGEGNVLVPAEGNVEIEFDSFGCYTGKYAVQTPRGGKSARAAARAAAEWSFVNPAAGTVAIAVNEADKSVTIHSESANRNYFVLLCDSKGAWKTNPSIENLDELKKNALVDNGSGIYTGTVEGVSDIMGFSFTKSPFAYPDTSIKYYYYDDASTDLSPVGQEIEVFTDAEIAGMTRGIWDVSGIDAPSDITFAYDPANWKMTFTRQTSGVEQIAAGDSGLRVNAGRGMIVINASAAADLTIFNIQGMAVKSVSVDAGVTTVALAPGLYIVAGEKVYVR